MNHKSGIKIHLEDNWLVVSTHLKYMSQIGTLPHIVGVKREKNVFETMTL